MFPFSFFCFPFIFPWNNFCVLKDPFFLKVPLISTFQFTFLPCFQHTHNLNSFQTANNWGWGGSKNKNSNKLLFTQVYLQLHSKSKWNQNLRQWQEAMGQPESTEFLGKHWKEDASSFTHTWWQTFILCQLVKLHWFHRSRPDTCFWKGETRWGSMAGNLHIKRKVSVLSLPVCLSLKGPTQFFF